MKISILDDYQDAVRKLDCFGLLADHEVKVFNNTVKGAGQLGVRLSDSDALVLIRERTRITRDLLAKLPRLRLIAQTGKAGSHIDLDACTERGVLVVDGSGAPHAAAELTWALTMAAMRRLPQYIGNLKHGVWQQSGLKSRSDPPNHGVGDLLSGKTLGVWGLGRIGRMVAGYGKAFGMTVLVWGREGSQDAARELGYAFATDRHAFFAQADVVTLHLRLNDATRGLVTLEDLQAMKPTALLVNTSRAMDATTGAQIWAKALAPFVPPMTLPCHQSPTQPYGILSTPVIDSAARTLFTVGFESPDEGKTKKHIAHALSIDDGNERPGWPVDIGAKVKNFPAETQHQRGSLLLLGGRVFIPYSGIGYDCGSTYHGRVIGISETDPTDVIDWSTSAVKGGIWSGLASDGTSIFFATGNTIAGTKTWGGGEAVIRLSQSLQFSGKTTDYFAPSNWQDLDTHDNDLGSSTVVLFDLPGANPSKLAIAMGKYGTAHLVNRQDLGGIGKGDGKTGEGLFSAEVSKGAIVGNPASYTSKQGRYVVMRADGTGVSCPSGTSGELIALKIAPTSPPTFSTAWCAASEGRGSPIATTTDGESDPIVWVVSAQNTNTLLGFDGDTGAQVFDGGGATMTEVIRYTSPIVAKGRFYVGATGRIYAFNLP